MSSRNRYLTAAERAAAPALHAALIRAAAAVAAGADPRAACAEAAAAAVAAGFEPPDYLEARTADGLARFDRFDPATPARVFAAARLGRARLIDNVAIG
jgi:pantoate--beta-alanine ligase